MLNRFRDRTQAGQELGARLAAYAGRPDVVVLALPRGGVPIGFAVAAALGAPLDVLLVRKLGVPGERELAMGAIATDGVQVLNADIVRRLGISERTIARVAATEERELQRRAGLYRGNRPAPAIRDRTVILVDDGIATGATMRAAIAVVRQRQPARLVVAVPVAAAQTCDELRAEVDDLVCLRMPDFLFGIGAWYEEFPQLNDAEVQRLLWRAWQAGEAAHVM